MLKRIGFALALLAAVAVGELLAAQIRARFIVPAQAQSDTLSAGNIVFRLSGDCPAGYAEVSELNGKGILGTLSANGNQGGTGGSDNITPAGTNSAPSFTGSAWSAPAVSWPAGVPTFAGTAITFTELLNHTHTVSITDPGHTHTQNVNSATTGGLNGYGVDTSTNTSSASGFATASNTTGITASTANPGGGVASFQKTPAGTVAWPAGVPTIGAYTPAGSVAAPTFSGTQFDNRSAFVRLIACVKS